MPDLDPSPFEQRAIRISRIFGVLLPLVLAIFGIVLLLGVLLISTLRNPALIAALTGLLTVIGTVGYAKRESK